MPPNLVKKRCVFHLIGYEPLAPERIHRRFQRGLEQFGRTWNVSATLSPLAPAPGGAVVSWRIGSGTSDWRVETEVTLLDWSDIVAADFTQPRWRILVRGLLAIADFLFSRAPFGYLRTNWRYLLFFLYPLVLLALFVAGGWLIAALALASGMPWPSVLGPAIAIAVLLALLRWCGPRLYLDYTLCDWTFAADLVRRRRPDLDARLDRMAQEFAERVQKSEGEEIVVISHSFGAVMMMLVVARALRHAPQLARRGIPINLVSTGSSLLKIGLHPAAAELRRAVHDIIEEPAISWVEYQALVDPVNFYKTDPVAEMGLPPCGKPIVRIVRIRDMLTPEHYRSMRGNFFRIHRQFVLANERRYFYDFFMLCCGPLALREWLERPDDAMARFADAARAPHAAAAAMPVTNAGTQ
jgi:hypothetical protein